MSKQTVYNINDSRFALVEWVSNKDYSEYSVISMNDVEVLSNEQREYELEQIYKARFAGAKYRAKILYIGLKEECDKKEAEIISFKNEQTDSLKTRPNKSSTAKVITNLTNNNRDECRFKLLESQISDLHHLLEEKENKIKSLDQKIKLLEERNNELEAISNQTNRENDKLLVEKLINHAAYVYSTFGTKEDLSKIAIPASKENSDKTVLISSNYDFRMPKALKQQLNAISLNEKTSDTMIYRDLIKGVITDPIVLGNANAEYLMNNHPVVFACKEFVLELRPGFTDAKMKKCLRELCCEARQSVWKKEDKLFVVDGKEYKRPDPNNDPQANIKKSTEKVKRASENIMSSQTKKAKQSINFDKSAEKQSVLDDISNTTVLNSNYLNSVNSSNGLNCSIGLNCLNSPNSSVFSQLTSTQNVPTVKANFAQNFIDYSYQKSSALLSFSETNNLISKINNNINEDDDTTRDF